MVRGTVYHCTWFRFKDGMEKDKLLVLLNEPEDDEPYIVCKTTSNPKYKSQTPGCDSGRSLFLLTGSHDFFSADTWLQLYELYSFPAGEFLQLAMDGKLQRRHQLRVETIGQIVNCVKVCEDVSACDRQLVCRKS